MTLRLVNGGEGSPDPHPEAAEASGPAISVDLRRLQPLEIVLLSRYAIGSDASTDGFPSIDACCESLTQQLRELPETDLSYARIVYNTFASSPYPIDRMTIGLNLRGMTLADHDTGFELWSQLVRDENWRVRRDVYEQINTRFQDINRPPALVFAEEGLTIDDAGQLRDQYIEAAHPTGQFAIGRTALSEALEEATKSFHSFTIV